ncbi:hypothetical protein HJ588_12410 [Flexivirga sp. ID2601S]|uniref:Uncharacterized protein n=1 Tax=Flexivirga aerilata TaxID=1656889 RepID=A0A849AHY7_9MICO|nr:hypothetical protein [Flexivirga aerilata]NNG40065.1 hypothetical protein [Flexivirga aerilata]
MSDQPITPRSVVHARRGLGYLLLGFLTTLMPVPYNIVALVPLVASAVESVLTLRALAAARTPGPIKAWTSVGLALTVALIVMVAVPYVFWGTTQRYETCMSKANTKTTQAVCKQQLSDRSNDMRRLITGS